MKTLISLLRFILLISGIIALVLLLITSWSAQNLYLNLKDNGFLNNYEIENFISIIMMFFTSSFICLISAIICKRFRPEHFSNVYLFAIEDTVIKKYYEQNENILSVREVFIPKGMTIFFPNCNIHELPETLRIDGVSNTSDQNPECKRLFPGTSHIDQFFMGNWLPAVPPTEVE